MANPFHANILDVFPVPEFVPGISSLLADVWSRLGLDAIDIAFEVPDVDPTLPDFSDTLTEEESLALLDEFDSDSDGSDPITDTGTPPDQPATPVPVTERTLTFALAAFSEIQIAIPG